VNRTGVWREVNWYWYGLELNRTVVRRAVNRYWFVIGTK
jgi:hypothetical protein